MEIITVERIQNMDYVSFMGFLNETNRPPGGKDSIRRMAQNAFLTADSHVLHSGCNTGYCSYELSHLTKCRVTAIDINKNMLTAANKRLKKEPSPYKNLITFELGNAHKLTYGDNTFDLVMSGGSTAFMEDKNTVIDEYVRVCKPYGFVGDVVLYYHTNPPSSVLKRINSALNISIQEWKKEDWVSLYTNAGLEEYYTYKSEMAVHPTDKDVHIYCEILVRRLSLEEKIHCAAVKKLYDYMYMFNENHKYLSYAVLLFRKTSEKEQVSLFGV